MIALTGCLLVVLVAMLMVPDTEFAKLCHEQLVERPVRALSRFRSHHLLYTLILIPVMLSGAEFIALLGPEFFAAYAMELAIYLDAVIVSLALSAYTAVRSSAQRLRFALASLLGRKPRARARRSAAASRPERQAANDDEDRPAPRRAA